MVSLHSKTLCLRHRQNTHTHEMKFSSITCVVLCYSGRKVAKAHMMWNSDRHNPPLTSMLLASQMKAEA